MSKALEAPDKERCQAEKKASFMQMGGPLMRRCAKRPMLIVKEKKPGPDGRRGSMSLCEECFAEFLVAYGPNHAIVRMIRPADPSRQG